jgi:hypothetical protein
MVLQAQSLRKIVGAYGTYFTPEHQLELYKVLSRSNEEQGASLLSFLMCTYPVMTCPVF